MEGMSLNSELNGSWIVRLVVQGMPMRKECL